MGISHLIGYWFLDDADVGKKKWSPPDDLVKFIDNAHTMGRKVVYIGFGSITVPNPHKMTENIVKAVLKSVSFSAFWTFVFICFLFTLLRCLSRRRPRYYLKRMVSSYEQNAAA